MTFKKARTTAISAAEYLAEIAAFKVAGKDDEFYEKYTCSLEEAINALKKAMGKKK